MNIVINAVLSYEQPRGVGRYLNNLLPALAAEDKKNQYYIYYGKWMSNYSFLQISQDNFHFIELEIKNTQISRNFYLAFILPMMCKKYKPDIYFVPDTQATVIKPCFMISTIHDLAEFEVPEKYSKKQAFIRRCIVRLQTKISNLVITVSDYSKNDICKRLGLSKEKVFVTYNALDTRTCNVTHLEPDNYFLFVSETERAKNLGVLIDAFSLLENEKDMFSIKVVGKKGNDYDNIIQKIKKYNLEKKVTFYGYLSDDELKEMYAKAYAFVFPSVFEGFGLPVLEAMGNGVPVLCSNVSSIPEVGGDAVLTFDPYDPEDLKSKMLQIIGDKKMREKMIDRGLKRSSLFTPQSAALETLKIFHYKELGEKH